MKKREKKISETEKVKAGMLMSVIMLSGGIVFGIVGLWFVSIIIFIILGLILIISFIISLFPKLHGKEYNKLNPIQKIFSTSSYVIEMVGYLG